MLDCLATTSEVEIEAMWKSFIGIVFNLCKVNKQLALEIQVMIGLEWLSGQAFSNLYFTLAISEGIKSMLVTFQSDIGADKLFHKIVSFEMNIEDKVVIILILDYWMRLNSIRWQTRMWNKYKSFTDYADSRGYQNVCDMFDAITLVNWKKDVLVGSTKLMSE